MIEPNDNDDLGLTYHVPTPKSSSQPPLVAHALLSEDDANEDLPTVLSPPTLSQPIDSQQPKEKLQTEEELMEESALPISQILLNKLHGDPTNLPPVRPANTKAPCENRTTFDTLKLHKIFGCRKFRNQKHVTAASSNAKLIQPGELPPTLGSFSTITNPPSGKTSRKRRRYLDKVHMDIVFGNCLSLGGYRYALIIVDVATRYCWIYGMSSIASANVVMALESFRSDAGGVPRTFHMDFDQKLMGGKALRWILAQNSRVIAANSGRQSSNGLVERTWRTIVQMARSYITEKQVGREMWFFALLHSAHMINQVPGRLGRQLTSPFELVHGVKPDSSTWCELFSVGYFNHNIDNATSRSKTEDQSLDGIAVGRDDTTNTIIFYNPLTRSYYRPPAFRLDEGRLPVTTYPQSIKYDGGLTCGLYRNRTDPVSEPFPPGTRITLASSGESKRGTIKNIPLLLSDLVSTAANTSQEVNLSSITSSNKYTIQFDDGTTAEATFEDLVKVDICRPRYSSGPCRHRAG